ncbi:MAG: DUF4271 domain-containing protein [Bacteroidia bacterium]|jgi:hypothetical protein|nr:DUF4271 domain-containing protein [Bacteroidota bacterium]MBP7245691.1 DUF4271 domain-containing protein [Bacteroidia bacterium]
MKEIKTEQDTATHLTHSVTGGLTVDSGAAPVKNVFRFQDEEDSNPPTREDSVVQISKSLQGPRIFQGHLLRPQHPSAQPLTNEVGDWFTISLIVLVALFTWFRFFYYRIFRQLFTAFYNLTTTNQIVRDESVLLQRASLILSIISYMLMGLFLYQISIFLDWDMGVLQGGLIRFVFLSLSVAVAYSVKMVLLRFLSTVFDLEKPVALYIFNVFLMIMMIGLLLLPINILLAYGPLQYRYWILLIAVGIITLLFAYRLVRAIGIWIGIPGFSLFYLFLYLCTFEIAPLLIIWKMTGM